MGQGYKAIILASQPGQSGEIIRTWVDPHSHDQGYKLMEHSYIGNPFVGAVEYLISPLGMFYKSRVVWSGDYADKEREFMENLYVIADEEPNLGKASFLFAYDMSSYRYIVNHTTLQYVDKNKELQNIHLLPLLTAEGNGRGGGDYEGENVGTWARNVISIEKEIPDGYKELICKFYR